LLIPHLSANKAAIEGQVSCKSCRAYNRLS
jgi:hypothetical protein